MEDKNFDFVMEAAMLGGASCGEVEKLLALPGMDSVRAAKLRVMINNIKSMIRNIIRYNTAPAAPQGFHSCRILKIDDKLKAAVFSAGYPFHALIKPIHFKDFLCSA